MTVDGFLIDLDGVLYNGDTPIKGSIESVTWLKERNLPHLFLTNTTSQSRSAIVAKVGKMGLSISEDQILTPPIAAYSWLSSRTCRGIALFAKDAIRGEFKGLPIQPQTGQHDVSHVIIGDLGREWSFERLNDAFRLLHGNLDATLIALGMTRYYQAADGITLDVAPFVKALEYASDRVAVVLGKPAPDFFDVAANLLGLEAERLLMIGDDIRTDVEGAMDAGLLGGLVKTGKYRPEDLEGGIVPDIVIDSIAEIPHRFADLG